MCLMDGLIIQAVLAEFDNGRDRRSIWDKHAERIALGNRTLSRQARGRKSWADTAAQVAERLLRRFLPELGRVFGHGLFSDRGRRR
jgi:hypothetical protein